MGLEARLLQTAKWDKQGCYSGLDGTSKTATDGKKGTNKVATDGEMGLEAKLQQTMSSPVVKGKNQSADATLTRQPCQSILAHSVRQRYPFFSHFPPR